MSGQEDSFFEISRLVARAAGKFRKLQRRAGKDGNYGDAWHESSHAVVGTEAFGVPPVIMAIGYGERITEGLLWAGGGRRRFAGTHRPLAMCCWDDDDGGASAKALIVMALGGAAAEALMDGAWHGFYVPESWPACGDLDGVTEIAIHEGLGEGDLLECFRQALAIIEAHAGEISALAEALLERGVLLRQDIDALMAERRKAMESRRESLRKPLDVLPVSDPESPDPNPFVEARLLEASRASGLPPAQSPPQPSSFPPGSGKCQRPAGQNRYPRKKG